MRNSRQRELEGEIYNQRNVGDLATNFKVWTQTNHKHAKDNWRKVNTEWIFDDSKNYYLCFR